MTKEEMIQSLKKALKPERFRHTMNVVETAVRLSAANRIDSEKAYLAALLHDCAKSMLPGEMISICEEAGIYPDEFELATESILHAPAGAALAKVRYGIQDAEILNAIRYHTIGCNAPEPLTKLIYVSDFAEPGRKPFDGLNEVRRLMEEDLDRALILSATLSSEYVLKCGGSIHPLTNQMILNTEVHP